MALVAIVTLGIGLRSADRSQQPTAIKSYPCRPGLQNRIHIPKSYHVASSNSGNGVLLPLYIDLHGGGWAHMEPSIDDEFCSDFSNRFNVVVVSVDYHKSPSHRFPTQVHDVAAIARAVIDDNTLPIDRGKVALGGFSAGANLAFAVSQLDDLRGVIRGVVGFYGVYNLDTSPEES